MLEVSQVLECKQLHARGQSVRAISKSLGVSRNTVRGYLRGDRLPGEDRLGEGRARVLRRTSAGITPGVRRWALSTCVKPEGLPDTARGAPVPSMPELMTLIQHVHSVARTRPTGPAHVRTGWVSLVHV